MVTSPHRSSCGTWNGPPFGDLWKSQYLFQAFRSPFQSTKTQYNEYFVFTKCPTHPQSAPSNETWSRSAMSSKELLQLLFMRQSQFRILQCLPQVQGVCQGSFHAAKSEETLLTPPNSSWLPSPIFSLESDLPSLPATGMSIDNQQFVTPVIQQIIALKNGLPNAFGARILVLTHLNIPAWESKLLGYHDRQIVDFLRCGWPVNYTANQLPISTDKNQSSAISYANHVQHYVNTELRYHAIASPFHNNPFPQPLICCPLQTVPKRGSSKRRMVME